MGAALTQQLALGVGAAGALVLIDPKYVRFPEGVTAVEGRDDPFRSDVPAGQIDFYLENQDGRFTPDNLTGAAAAGYSTAMTEGTAVSWSRGGKLWYGKVQGIQFAGSEADWGIVHVTADDQLGAASRTNPKILTDAIVRGSSPYFYWPLDDAGAPAASAVSGVPALAPSLGGGTIDWAQPAAGSGALQVTLTALLNTSVLLTSSGPFPTITYPTTSMGSWGVWMTPNASYSALRQLIVSTGLGAFGFTVSSATGTPAAPINIGAIVGSLYTDFVFLPQPGQSYYVSCEFTTTLSGTWTITGVFKVNGVQIGTLSKTGVATVNNSLKQPTTVTLQVVDNGAYAPGTVTFSHLSHTPLVVREDAVNAVTTESVWLTALASAASADLDTLPALSSASIGPAPLSGSVLDLMNDVIRTEQGYINVVTSGTLLSPVPKLTVRERTRPQSTAITANNTFDAVNELQGVPQFVRDLTYLVSIETATGPTQSVSYPVAADPAIIKRVGNKYGQDTVLLRDQADLYTWASDRLYRGANIQLKVAVVSVDALVTPTDRSADLLALKQGDRIRVTNIPSPMLGFTTWDGWIIGIKERHNLHENRFDFYVAPVLADAAIYDTNRYMADGALTLSAAIVSTSATTMSVATTGPLLETVDVPYTLLIDSEQVTVTACNTATPQVATITRGVNGTTAATHTTAATVELATASLYAF